MYVRRKSNWYIYFAAFGITIVFVLVAIAAFRWYLFPSETNDTENKNATGQLTDDFVPTAEDSFNVLSMISNGVNDNPEFFFMVEFNAPENRVAFVPIPAGISVATEGRTLPNVYAAQGGAEVVKVVKNEIGIDCNAFIKMDKLSFEDFLTSFGNVEYTLPKTIMIKGDDDKITTINSGRQLLKSEDIYMIMMDADFEEGESYKFKISGDILTELVNQNYHNIDGNLLDTYVGMIMRNAETNLTDELYKKHKAAILNTIEYGVSPAEFYVPYGEYTDDGGFKISENSIISIKQKAGLA